MDAVPKFASNHLATDPERLAPDCLRACMTGLMHNYATENRATWQLEAASTAIS